jgi:tetratricopeptide (TPR) repeat protein
VTGKKPGEISPEEYDLVTDPARELTRRAAAAARTIAGLGPLLFLLDTGEVIGDRAWAWLRRVMTQTGSQVAWVVAGRFADLGRSEDALADYDQALALEPGHAAAHFGRGVTLADLGRSEDALAALDQAITLDPGNAAAHVNRGIALAALGNLDQALADFDTADDLAPDDMGEASTWAGAILWHRRDPASARDRFSLVKGRVTGCTPFHTAVMDHCTLRARSALRCRTAFAGCSPSAVAGRRSPAADDIRSARRSGTTGYRPPKRHLRQRPLTPGCARNHQVRFGGMRRSPVRAAPAPER